MIASPWHTRADALLDGVFLDALQRAVLIDRLALALSQEWTLCALELEQKAAQIDAIAAKNTHHEWLHGTLTDKADFVRNLAAGLRRSP